MALEKGRPTEAELDAPGNLTGQVFVAPSGSGPGTAYRWLERRGLTLPVASGPAFHQVHAEQCVVWLGALAGVRLDIDPAAKQRLQRTEVSLSGFSRRTIENALLSICERAGVVLTAGDTWIRLTAP